MLRTYDAPRTTCEESPRPDVKRLALPPPRFHEAVSVERALRRPFRPGPSARRRPTPAQLAGLRYEKKVKEWLALELRPWFEEGVWFEYHDYSGMHYCQLDGLSLDPVSQTAILFEVKLRWCADAWWQLCRLYAPVLRVAFPTTSFIPVVITRTYDPAIVVPSPPVIVSSLAQATAPGSSDRLIEDDVRVLLWR